MATYSDYQQLNQIYSKHNFRLIQVLLNVLSANNDEVRLTQEIIEVFDRFVQIERELNASVSSPILCKFNENNFEQTLLDL